MEGIAKTAISTVSVPIVLDGSTKPMEMNADKPSIPTDMYRHFNLDWATEEKTINKLRDIYDWAGKDLVGSDYTVGNVMQNIGRLERKLGASTGSQEMYDKLWNWVKMEASIEDIRKRQANI